MQKQCQQEMKKGTSTFHVTKCADPGRSNSGCVCIWMRCPGPFQTTCNPVGSRPPDTHVEYTYTHKETRAGSEQRSTNTNRTPEHSSLPALGGNKRRKGEGSQKGSGSPVRRGSNPRGGDLNEIPQKLWIQFTPPAAVGTTAETLAGSQSPSEQVLINAHSLAGSQSRALA